MQQLLETIRQLRLMIFVLIFRIATWFLPEDATNTWKWIINMPLEK